MRKDTHRPSAIDPEDYISIGWDYLGPGHGDLGLMLQIGHERRRVAALMAEQGWRYSRHEHGGTCGICGAHAHYLVLWLHRPSGEVLRAGETCSEKMGLCDRESFQKARKAVLEGRRYQAGRQRYIEALDQYGGFEGLADRSLPKPGARPWLSPPTEAPEGCAPWASWVIRDFHTLSDLCDRLFRYGDWTEKQIVLARTIWTRVKGDPWEAARHKARQRAQEDAKADPAPEGRTTVDAIVLKLYEPDEGAAFPAWKMLIKTAGGWRAFLTRPASLRDVQVGAKIRLAATWKPKERTFAYGSRPAKAKVIAPPQ